MNLGKRRRGERDLPTVASARRGLAGRAREAVVPNRARAAAPHGRSARALQKEGSSPWAERASPNGGNVNLTKAPPSPPKLAQG